MKVIRQRGRLAWLFEPRDCWIGWYWDKKYFYLTAVPMLPLRITREVTADEVPEDHPGRAPDGTARLPGAQGHPEMAQEEGSAVNTPGYRCVSPPRLLKNMWDDKKPTRGEAIALTICVALLIAMVYLVTPRGWWWLPRIALDAAVWTVVLWVLLSVPRVQRWIWEGK